jgi:phage FluMu gp28-like protein
MTALRPVLQKTELFAIEAWLTTFFPYQLAWLLEPSRFAMCLKARQIGMSHTTAAAAVLWAVAMGETTMIISTDLETAGVVLQMCFKHAKVLEKLGAKQAKCRMRGAHILFDNGGEIVVRPASSGGRGFSGNVFLDEFAYVENPKELWDSASSLAMHGFSKIRVSSTPNGVGNEFHNLWTNPLAYKGWKQHKVGIKEAREGGLELEDELCWRIAKGDARVYAQIYECSFLDSSEQYIPTKMVMDAIMEDTEVVIGETYGGYDVGLEKDLSVLVRLRQVLDNSVWVQSIWTGKRTEWAKQKEVIFQAFYDHDIKKFCMDSTGLGTGLVKEVQALISGHKVEGVPFSLKSKEEMMTDMYQAFAAGMIKIPNDPDLIRDILSIRRIVTESGNVRYDAPSTADGHADRAWALALAIHACANKPGKRVARGPGDFDNT